MAALLYSVPFLGIELQVGVRVGSLKTKKTRKNEILSGGHFGWSVLLGRFV